jgi:hypothetical protein
MYLGSVCHARLMYSSYSVILAPPFFLFWWETDFAARFVGLKARCQMARAYCHNFLNGEKSHEIPALLAILIVMLLVLS